MRIPLTFVVSLLLASNFGAAQQPSAGSSCGFTVQGEPTQPTVKGPDDILPLVYVVEQPDSPLEVVSVDLEGMWISISNEQHTEKDCAKYTIHNRSNRPVQGLIVMLRLATSGGAGGGAGTVMPGSAPLAAGQTVEISSCGVTGSGSAQNNYVRLLVYVESVDLGNCYYKPSIRVPRSLKINTPL